MMSDAVTLPQDHVALGALEGSLGFLLRLAQVQVFEEFFEAHAARGLKPGEFTLLWVISLNAEQRQGAIAQTLRIKAAHMTKLVERMVQAGYVERRVPADDRRAVILSLAPKGAEILARNRTQFLDHHQKERAGLSDAEYAQLVGLLKKFIGLDATP
jgi:DNA-binding MarR family transcriptional regulator